MQRRVPIYYLPTKTYLLTYFWGATVSATVTILAIDSQISPNVTSVICWQYTANYFCRYFARQFVALISLSTMCLLVSYMSACMYRRLAILSTPTWSLTFSAFLTLTSHQYMDEDYYTQRLHCGNSEAEYKTIIQPVTPIQTNNCHENMIYVAIYQ